MTGHLQRWSTLASDTERLAFGRRFAGCAATIRGAANAHCAPSSSYTAAVLDLARSRAADLFLYIDDEREVGRAAVFMGPGDEPWATIGLFEALPKPDGEYVASILIDEACAWAAESGAARIYGPVDLNTWFSYRFLVPSPDQSATRLFDWEPIHPPQYLNWFRGRGFEDAFAYETLGIVLPEEGPYGIEGVLSYLRLGWDAAVSAGYQFEQLRSDTDLDALLEELHPLCNEAFSENLLFEPLPLPVFRAMYGSTVRARDFDATHCARDAAGRLAGFVFAFVDGDAMVVKTIAVAPRARGHRLSTALMHQVTSVAAERGLHTLISALVRRGNVSEFLSGPFMVPGVRTWVHEYTLLEKGLRP